MQKLVKTIVQKHSRPWFTLVIIIIHHHFTSIFHDIMGEADLLNGNIYLHLFKKMTIYIYMQVYTHLLM